MLKCPEMKYSFCYVCGKYINPKYITKISENAANVYEGSKQHLQSVLKCVVEPVWNTKGNAWHLVCYGFGKTAVFMTKAITLFEPEDTATGCNRPAKVSSFYDENQQHPELFKFRIFERKSRTGTLEITYNRNTYWSQKPTSMLREDYWLNDSNDFVSDIKDSFSILA